VCVSEVHSSSQGRHTEIVKREDEETESARKSKVWEEERGEGREGSRGVAEVLPRGASRKSRCG
jgi:hypothetical protein